MRAALVVLALLVLGLLPVIPYEGRAAGDMNWLVPGLRVWYRGTYASPGGGQGGPSAISTERVFTIKELGAGGATVHVLTASQYYSQVVGDRDEVVPRPAEEGHFWISPARLAGLRQGDVVTWIGDEYQVSDRGVYGFDDFVNKYMLDATPALAALFTAGGGRREVVALTGAIQERAVYTFIFDAETGLLLGTIGRDAYQESTSVSAEVLAEINYDFISRKAFPEPDGPHPDYRMEFYYVEPLSGVMIDLQVDVIGRYADIIMYAMTVMASGGGSVPYTAAAMIWSGDGAAYGKLMPVDIGTPTLNIGLTDKAAVIGDHLPFYIGEDVSANTIRVWNVTMINNGRGEFVAQGTAPFYFQTITFDREGYAAQVTIYLSEVGAPVQLTTDNPGFQSQRQVYAERLGPTAPQPPTTTTTTTTTTATQTTASTTATVPQPTTTHITQTTATTSTTTTQASTSLTGPPTAPTGAAQPAPTGSPLPPAVIGAVAGVAVGAAVLAALIRRRA